MVLSNHHHVPHKIYLCCGVNGKLSSVYMYAINHRGENDEGRFSHCRTRFIRERKTLVNFETKTLGVSIYNIHI